MRLIFHDRRAEVLTAAAGPAALTVERKGNFSLNNAVVAALGLAAGQHLSLVQDADTNTWYLLPGSAEHGFELRPRDKKGKALLFCSAPRARAYYQAHGLNGQTSVRTLVAATSVQHEGLTLYPLAPQHGTLTPSALVPAEAPAPVVADAPAAPAEVSAPIEEVATPVEEPAQVAAAPEAIATVPASETDEERMERLTDYWYERSIKDCPDEELNDLQAMLAAKRWKDRDIVENHMLNRCKTERIRRDKVKGASRG